MGSSHTPEVVDGPLAVADVPGGRLVTADSCRSHMQEVVGDLYRKCSFCPRVQELSGCSSCSGKFGWLNQDAKKEV